MANENNNTGNNAMVVSRSDLPVTVGMTADGRPIVVYREGHFGSEEEALGQQDRSTGHTRRTAPEEANSDIVEISPSRWFETADRLIDSVVQIEGMLTVTQADYNTLANMQYLRDAAALVSAIGRNDQTGYALAASSGHHTQYAFSSPNAILGFQVEWGISPLQAAAFNMVVNTYNFKGFAGQSVDRNFTLRANPQVGQGGIFTFLFANRTQGVSEGYHYNGTGGMNVAIIQPAILGDLDDTSTSTPYIDIVAPTTLDSYVNFYVRPITAASPSLAALRQRLGDLTGG